MTEADVFNALTRAFPHDEIKRVGRGTKGADILHTVMNDGKPLGLIAYECKDTATWQNDWVSKAMRCQSQYQTKWIVIASRSFPAKEKGFCTRQGIPIIELRSTVRLAEVIRSAVVQIASLRLSTDGRDEKAQKMLDYIVGDHFASRFKMIAEAVSTLRDQQHKERQWHENAWAKQAKSFEGIESSRREVDARVHTIAETPGHLRLVRRRA